MNQLLEGIYLETKQSKVGTGHTASRVTFKNYYALRLSGQDAVLFLLDDNLGLTGLRESVPISKVVPRLEYQPDLQSAFEALLPKLASRPVAPAPRPAATAVQTVTPAPPPQARPAAPAPQTRPSPQPPAKPAPAGETPWWEMTQKGASNLLKKD